MVLLGGATETAHEGIGGFQEWPQLESVRAAVKFAARPAAVELVPRQLERAVRTAVYGRPGPTYVDLPGDLLNTRVPASSVSLGPAPVMLLRLVQGAGGGLSFPALTVLVAAWAPPPQRSSLTAVCFSGSSLGTVASVAGSGWLAAWLGWEAVFYVQGGLACCWCLVWAGLVADTPGQHRSAGRAQGCI